MFSQLPSMKSMTNLVEEGITSMIVIQRGRGRITLYYYFIIYYFIEGWHGTFELIQFFWISAFPVFFEKPRKAPKSPKNPRKAPKNLKTQKKNRKPPLAKKPHQNSFDETLTLTILISDVIWLTEILVELRAQLAARRTRTMANQLFQVQLKLMRIKFNIL